MKRNRPKASCAVAAEFPAEGFADVAAPTLPRSIENLYPCPLTDATDQALGQLARDLVKAWGDRTLTVIELEERIATAAEKAPTEDPQIQALREAIAGVKTEYDAVVKQEEAAFARLVVFM